MPEDSKTVRTMAEQTLPDFLFSVILEQRKSIATLVDALNEAKAGIDQLVAEAERREESRRQAETAKVPLRRELAAKARSESEVEDNTTAPERLATIRTYQSDNGTMLPDDK